MEDLISIVVPIYNVEKYLDKCIKSIINQSYKKLEIILVDDGSKDNCGKMCEEYRKIDKRIKVIHKKNGGLSSARNAGIKIATGKYIGFIDSDDWIEKDMFKEMIKLAKENNSDIVQCDFIRCNEENLVIDNTNKKIVNIYSNIEAIWNQYKKGIDVSSIVTWNKLYKKSLFNDIEFPEGKINEDEFTIYKLFYYANKVVYTNKIFYYYRQNPNSIMNTSFSKKNLDYLDAYEEKADFIKGIGEEKLFEHTMNYYYNALIHNYIKYQKLYKEDKKTLKELRDKRDRAFKNFNGINMEHKFMFRIFRISPFLYRIVFKLQLMLNK